MIDIVDTLLFAYPDSAFELLESVDTTSLCREEMMRWHLLRTKASYKSYRDISGDTVLKTVTDFYQGIGDSLEWQSAFYYGVVMESRECYDATLIPYMVCYQKALDAGDYFFAGMAARGLAFTYDELMIPAEIIKWSQIARNCFEKSGHPKHAQYMLIPLCDGLHLEEQHKEILELCHSIDSCTLRSDINYHRKIAHALFNANYGAGNYEEAIISFNKYKELTAKVGNRSIPSNKWSQLSNLYILTGDINSAIIAHDSAYKYLKTKTDTLFLSLIDTKLTALKGNYREAYEKALQWGWDMTADGDRRFMYPTASVLTNYFELKASEQVKINRIKNRTIILISICAFLLFIAVVAVILRHRERMRLEILKRDTLLSSIDTLTEDLNTTACILQETREKLNMSDSRTVDVRQRLGVALASRFSELNSISALIYENTDCNGNLKYDKVAKKVSGLLKDFNSLKNIAELEQGIDFYADGWMTQFRRDFPNLNESQYTLVIYLFYGFSTTTIAYILGKNNHVVHQMKYRLKQQIASNLSVDIEALYHRLGMTATPKIK